MLNKDKELFEFLSNAPKEFREGEQIKKYQMKNGDFIHCVLWNMHFYITGTDIVKILLYRFQTSNRQIGNLKKFEEGIFSDLRNLKPGIDATLEGPRSEFLEFLYKNGCIRTQKKQKVFYWYSVPHDALFCDALERDLRRESNMQSYNNYMSSLTRNPSEFALLQSPHRHQRPLTDFDARYKAPISNVRPSSTQMFDNLQDPLRMYNPQVEPMNNIKVYPEFDDYEQDMFYRDTNNRGLFGDFYSPSVNKEINPAEFSKPANIPMKSFDFLNESDHKDIERKRNVSKGFTEHDLFRR